MKSKDQIREEIEILRKKLNEKTKENIGHTPDEETMVLSRKIDELLNLLNEDWISSIRGSPF